MNLEIHKPELVQRVKAHAPALISPAGPPRARPGQDLIDVSAKVRGLLTDEEVDKIFSRNRSGARPVNFE